MTCAYSVVASRGCCFLSAGALVLGVLGRGSSAAFGARVCECGEEGPTKAHGLLLITCNLFHGQSQKEIHTLYPGSRELLLYIYACPHALGLRICNVQCLGSKCQRELDGAARKWSVTDSPGIYSGFASPAAFGPKDRMRSVTP